MTHLRVSVSHPSRISLILHSVKWVSYGRKYCEGNLSDGKYYRDIMKTMNHVNVPYCNVGAVMADRMMFLDSSVIWKVWCYFSPVSGEFSSCHLCCKNTSFFSKRVEY